MPDPAEANLETYARRAVAWQSSGEGVPPDTERLDRFILRVGRPVPIVLACGADLGPLCHELDRLGAAAAGIDPSAEAVALARARYPTGDLRKGDLRQLPWPRASFDGAVIGAAICRLTRHDAGVALGEVHRVLRMGALLAVDLLPGDGEGPEPTPHGPLYTCRWPEERFIAACDALDLQLLESVTADGRLQLLFRREY